MEYVKLSSLVGQDIQVKSVGRFTWKKWNPELKKMETSLNWIEGYRKLYPVETDKGTVDMSSAQIGSMLEGVIYEGKSDLIGKTFNVKSNGKTGMDIRYFINPVRREPEPENPGDIPEDADIL